MIKREYFFPPNEFSFEILYVMTHTRYKTLPYSSYLATVQCITHMRLILGKCKVIYQCKMSISYLLRVKAGKLC